MTASVLLAHPYDRSFNHAIYETVRQTLFENGVTVFSHDLYKEGFNPVLSRDELGKKPAKDRKVRQYTRELVESDVLVFIHPNWWGQPPAILKGYIDRVIRPPHAYEFAENDSGGGIPMGRLAGKVGVVFNTSNTEESRENNYFGDPLRNIWEKCVFGFCGIDRTYRRAYRILSDSTERDRALWLSDAAQTINEAIRSG
jgi:putative NADPH-quinone reductase